MVVRCRLSLLEIRTLGALEASVGPTSELGGVPFGAERASSHSAVLCFSCYARVAKRRCIDQEGLISIKKGGKYASQFNNPFTKES